MLGKVARLDLNIENGTRGKFARMAIYINLGKALVSQVMVNGSVQRVEYEHLPMVCFSCGHYRHVKEICPRRVTNQEETGVNITSKVGKDNCNFSPRKETSEPTSRYGPWMLVEKKGRHGTRAPQKGAGFAADNTGGTRFQFLNFLSDKDREQVINLEDKNEHEYLRNNLDYSPCRSLPRERRSREQKKVNSSTSSHVESSANATMQQKPAIKETTKLLSSNKSRKDKEIEILEREGSSQVLAQASVANGVGAIVAHLEYTSRTISKDDPPSNNEQGSLLDKVSFDKIPQQELKADGTDTGVFSIESDGIVMEGEQGEIRDAWSQEATLSHDRTNKSLSLVKDPFSNSKGLIATPICLTEGVLDPAKHLAVIFHENGSPESPHDSPSSNTDLRKK